MRRRRDGVLAQTESEYMEVNIPKKVTLNRFSTSWMKSKVIAKEN